MQTQEQLGNVLSKVRAGFNIVTLTVRTEVKLVTARMTPSRLSCSEILDDVTTVTVTVLLLNSIKLPPSL